MKEVMNGVDIASYQAGMDCTKIEADFVIVKATQGTGYTNPYFSKHYAQAVAAGKLVGAYHYASGGDANAEADYFLRIVGHRAGGCALFLDWEHNRYGGENWVFNTSREVEWVAKFMQRVHDKTGVWPLLYTSASVTRRRDWSPVAKHCGLWMAQYADYDITGYQGNPWTDGKPCGAWGRNIAIHQYSPSGSIKGYRCTRQHGLDMNIAYMTRDQWQAYARGDAKAAAPKKTFPDQSDKQLAVKVLLDIYGSGDTRRKKLAERWPGVQDIVDFYMESPGDMLTAIVGYLGKVAPEVLKKE